MDNEEKGGDYAGKMVGRSNEKKCFEGSMERRTHGEEKQIKKIYILFMNSHNHASGQESDSNLAEI